MTDMNAAIIPKSDQINADDLIGGPRTIRISGVNISPGADQPVSIKFEGETGKVWRPCKSMSRVLVAAWGADANKYEGRSVTLYRDPTVKWGGMAIGGIRISHMSDIDRQLTLALTETKGKRAPFVVKPLAASAPTRPSEAPRTAEPTQPQEPHTERPSTHPTATLEARADKVEAALRGSIDLAGLTKVWRMAAGVRDELATADSDRLSELTRLYTERDLELDTAGGFPGDEQ